MKGGMRELTRKAHQDEFGFVSRNFSLEDYRLLCFFSTERKHWKGQHHTVFLLFHPQLMNSQRHYPRIAQMGEQSTMIWAQRMRRCVQPQRRMRRRKLRFRQQSLRQSPPLLRLQRVPNNRQYGNPWQIRPLGSVSHQRIMERIRHKSPRSCDAVSAWHFTRK